MNILYVNGHPNPESFHAAIADAYVDAIDKTKHKVERLDLGELSFDPVLRYGYAKRMKSDETIERSQELVKWADHIVFAYPMWWGMMPSVMSGWISRVFTPGEAFQQNGAAAIPKQLLKGKTADIIITARAPKFAWGFGINDGEKPLTRNLFFYTGIKKKKLMVYDWAHLYPDSDKRRKKFLARIARRASNL